VLKYSISLNGNVALFTNEFKTNMESLFNNVSVNIDNTTSISKISVYNNSILILYMYCSVITFNERQTIEIKTYGNTITPSSFINEDLSSWGPQILYNKDGSSYGRSGFITAQTQKFVVDTLTVCLDDNKNTKNFVSFECNEHSNPIFIITPTNLNNIGFIGVTSFSENSIGLRTLTYNNQTTKEHNLLTKQITNSSITSMTNMFIPESTNGEYFPYVYLITAKENIEIEQIQFNNHIYLPCLNFHLALLIY